MVFLAVVYWNERSTYVQGYCEAWPTLKYRQCLDIVWRGLQNTLAVVFQFPMLLLYVCMRCEFQPFMAADVECEVNKFYYYNIKVVCCM
jgi:hypothetical protein